MRIRFRSGVLALVMPVLLSVCSGCTDMVRQELDDTHARLRALQELAGAVNRDLTTLDLIVRELDDGHTILPETLQLTEDGYEVSFRDGKKIFIPFGKDGADGRRLIPVGVKDEDGVYYWQVDGKWWPDEENRIRAGGRDGVPPQFKVEEGFWWISVDDGQTFVKFADCAEMDGMGVFRNVDPSSPGKVVLTLWGGEVIELSSQFPFRMYFADPELRTESVRDTVTIAAGETLPIPYKVIVEGETEQSPVVTSGTDGVYLSSLEAVDDTTGIVTVQAPADYVDGYIFLTASCSGYSALKMITFRERVITPAEPFITVRLGGGSDPKSIPYEANFDYVVQVDQEWLQAVPDPETGVLTFTPQPNEGDAVRECEVVVTPRDNPSYVCTTFRVIQGTGHITAQLEESSPSVTFDPETWTLSATAEGGDAVLLLMSPSPLSVSVPETAGWIQAEIVEEDGFWLLRVHVDPETAGSGRGSAVIIRNQEETVSIKVHQTGKEDTGE